MKSIAIVGAGYVADLYLRSLRLHPEIRIIGVLDRDAARLAAFCAHWRVPAATSLDRLLASLDTDGVVLNLTNPGSHFEISEAALQAGRHVWSEKPLAMTMPQATALTELAAAKGLRLGGAPCSHLSEAAQTVWAAVRGGVAGEVRLVYAEMDDDFIPQAPYRKWVSESGAPWPYEDEFRVGCTMEHAGYYLTWLVQMFGPVRTVVAASAGLAEKEVEAGLCAPDMSVGVLFFHSGVVARLSCSILAPHDHALRVIGDKGVIELEECWANGAPVKFRKRFALRRRLMNAPIARRLRLAGPTHRKSGRKGAASMNFALGPVEMLDAIAEGRPSRAPADLALHVNEVTLALQNAGEDTGARKMDTTCAPVEPMPWAMKLKGR